MSQEQPYEETGQLNLRKKIALELNQPDTDENIEPIRITQVERLSEGSLIKDIDMVRAIAQIQKVAATDIRVVPKEKRTIVGKNIDKRRENRTNGGNETMSLLGLEISEQKMGCEQVLEMNHTSSQNARVKRKK